MSPDFAPQQAATRLDVLRKAIFDAAGIVLPDPERVKGAQSGTSLDLLAAPQDRLTEDQIAYFTREAQVPPPLRSETTDSSYGGLKILFRRQSGNARITIFDGAHDKNTEAAFRWLNRQRKGR